MTRCVVDGDGVKNFDTPSSLTCALRSGQRTARNGSSHPSPTTRRGSRAEPEARVPAFRGWRHGTHASRGTLPQAYKCRSTTRPTMP